VGAALGRGESRETLVLFVLLTTLTGCGRLALSDRGSADGLVWIRGMDPMLERVRDRVSLCFESNNSRSRTAGALSGSLGFFRE
jgi:hypothetical protein